MKRGRLTGAEIRRAGSIKKAWAARKHGRRARASEASRISTKSPRKSAKHASIGKRIAAGRGLAPAPASGGTSMTKHEKRVAAGKKAAATRKRNAEAAARAKPKKAKATKPKKSGSGRRRAAYKRNIRVAVLRRNSKKPISAILVGTVPPRRAKPKKKPKKTPKESTKRASKAKETYMLQNPLGGAELFVGGITALVGFLAWNLTDRAIATHALTDSGNKDSAGNEQFTDTPPTSGAYTGLFNGTAILAPYTWKRWLAGIMFTVIPIGFGHLTQSNVGRSALQCFGFGAGTGFLGKALVGLVAKLSVKTAMGQRLMDAEMRATSLSQGTSGYPLSSLPSTGLGHVPSMPMLPARSGIGSCCGNCSAGLPCCNGSAPPPLPPMGTPVPPYIPPAQPNPPSTAQPNPPAPPPAPPPATQNTTIQGLPPQGQGLGSTMVRAGGFVLPAPMHRQAAGRMH